MNRLLKQSLAAAANLLLASAAHASLVTYEFSGLLAIGPMGDLAVPQDFSGRVSSFTPPLSGAGGFFIDEGAGGIFSGWFQSFTCTTCAPATSVPEPASLALFGLGLMGLGALRRRRT